MTIKQKQRALEGLQERINKINREDLNVNLKLLEKSWQTLKNLK